MRILTTPLKITERDTAEFPRTRSLYPHRRLGPALYDWGGFYAPQPGSDDRPAPPLMVAAVAKWREFALRNPRRALREQAEAERRASVSVADEQAAREEERRREKARKERTLLMEAQEVHDRKAAEGEHDLSETGRGPSSPPLQMLRRLLLRRRRKLTQKFLLPLLLVGSSPPTSNSQKACNTLSP